MTKTNYIIDSTKEIHPQWTTPNARAMQRYGKCKDNIFKIIMKDVRDNKGVTVQGVNAMIEHVTEAIAIEDHVFNGENNDNVR